MLLSERRYAFGSPLTLRERWDNLVYTIWRGPARQAALRVAALNRILEEELPQVAAPSLKRTLDGILYTAARCLAERHDTFLNEAEEQEICRVVLDWFLPLRARDRDSGIDDTASRPVLLQFASSTHHSGQPSLRLQFRELRRRLTGVKISTLFDYLQKRGLYYSNRLLGLDSEYNVHLVDEKLSAKLLEADMSWNALDFHYPGHTGIWWFSRVGFNPAKTQALIECAQRSGPRSGRRDIIMLVKSRAGIWSVAARWPVWISEPGNIDSAFRAAA